jgi:nucleoside-diphosphate-sugar epimerase
MNHIDIPEYIDDLDLCLSKISQNIELNGKTILITGATGLIGSFIVDIFIKYNRTHNRKVNIVSISRNEEITRIRFSYVKKDDNVFFIYQDIAEITNFQFKKIDFIIHAASNSDPKSFSENPVSTISANTIGTVNILEMAKKYNSKMVFLSSREVYGLVKGKKIYDESDYGLIDFNQIRSVYPESKRVGELFCRSYFHEYKTAVSIIRLGYVYGSTFTLKDSKVIAQFFRNAVHGNNIVIKSRGIQKRTYIYLTDAVNGILQILFNKFTIGDVYNIANSDSVITISELADIIARTGNVKKILEIPTNDEVKAWSPEQDVLISHDKLERLGWSPVIGIENGIKKTFEILRKLNV